MHGNAPTFVRRVGALPRRIPVVGGILQRVETTSWCKIGWGGYIQQFNQLCAWVPCGRVSREDTSTGHMRGGDVALHTTIHFKKGVEMPKKAISGGNANPSAPGGAIGGEGGMEYIRHRGMLQQRHVLDTHDDLIHAIREATGACIVFVYKRVGREARTWSVPATSME